MAISNQDITKTLDLSGQGSVAATDIDQVTDTAQPSAQRGLTIWSIDTALNTPDVPDPTASGLGRYVRYVWIRTLFAAASPGVYSYIWDTYATSDDTYLKWIRSDAAFVTASIPASLPPNGPAGGDLTGNYPNPSIAANVVDSTKLKSDATVDANRAVGQYHIQNKCIDPLLKLALSSGTAKQILRITTDGTAYEFIDPVNIGLKTLQYVAKAFSGGSVVAAVIPFDNTIPQITEGTQLIIIPFTPISATSILKIKFSCTGEVGVSTDMGIALFVGTGNDAVQAKGAASTSSSIGHMQTLEIDHAMTSPGTSAVNIQIRAGAGQSGNMYVNGTSTINPLYGGAAVSILSIEEIIGTLS